MNDDDSFYGEKLGTLRVLVDNVRAERPDLLERARDVADPPHLFIGGPKHGARLRTDDRSAYFVPVTSAPTAAARALKIETLRAHRYNRVEVEWFGGVEIVYAYMGLE